MRRLMAVCGVMLVTMLLAVAIPSALPGGVAAKGKSKAPSVLVEEHKEACMDAGGTSFDSVSAGGYTMSRCSFDVGLEEICDHTSGQSDCDTWQPHGRVEPAQIHYWQLTANR